MTIIIQIILQGVCRKEEFFISHKKITPAKEDYLKILLELDERNGLILSVDIASSLNVTKASVSHMMSVLKSDGYIQKEKYGAITLTNDGRKVATYVRQRYDILKSFLTDILGVEDEVADDDACKMEHIISFETLEKLSDCIKYN